MTKVLIEETNLTNIANAIREKTGKSDLITPPNMASEIEAIKSGGAIPKEKSVNFWDYDGTLLYSYTLAEARALTALPPLPTYEDTRFYASGWTKTLANVQSVQGFLDIVVRVKPTDTTYGYCFLFVVDTEKTSDRTVKLKAYKDSSSISAKIDWGDGKTNGLGTTQSGEYTHIYDAFKKYTIVIFATGKVYGGYGSNSSYMFTPFHVLMSAYADSSYFNPTKYCFYYCYNLRFAYLTKGANYLFNYCYKLHLAIGESLIANNVRDNCYSLDRACVTYPSGNNFTNNYNCTKLMVTNNANGGAIFSIPPKLKILFITTTTVTTYSAKITVGTLIYVTDDLVDSYKTATGWVDHANYIYPISSYTDE